MKRRKSPYDRYDDRYDDRRNGRGYDNRSSTVPEDRDRGNQKRSPLAGFNLPFNVNYPILAVMGAVFIGGIALGMGLSLSPSDNIVNVASRDVIDRRSPSPEICLKYGASAMVTDLRVFMTLNPFNVYVTQPVMQPGCVLRTNNWAILEQARLINSDQVNDCKRRMNTFGYTGSLEGSPKINCVYQNDAAGNLFLNPEGRTNVNAPNESENF
ncbi:DUF3172 domain-containing protein [Spirulina sp. 06S082]|uniref:DUF3172 domain-containing protein n=1 Tax=Spirulina sp. 06S082 TaxID=3110248 RepID=UPI002B1FB15E|nr:DUF3172 domain-containing protein [Spirulina sp. 06S082]MEA5471558.1 DUF3172 domain-containing protein [Spirulina sp. 06S082]